MPSSVGHALGAVALGWAVLPRPRTRRELVTSTVILAAIGVAPDLDLLIGRHSRETHSIGAAAITAGVAAWWRWPLASTRGQIFIGAFLAWVSHPFLDALGNDTTPPLGVTAWWPFSAQHIQTAWGVFAPISRSWTDMGAMSRNLIAMAHEALLLGPVVALVGWLRIRRSGPGL